MNKGTDVRISEYMEPNGACRIYIDYIGLRPETMRKCIDITKHLAKGDKFFFGHYRTDGLNIPDDEFVQYSKEIPNYFQE